MNKDFNLLPEIRDGWQVSEKDKRIWKTELDLTEELYRVCNKNGLKAVASGGTLLGAIRHNGFIPWDNDMDFIMTRQDYDALCNEFNNEFRSPYFLQTPQTERDWFRGHACLRNSKTTCISQLDKHNHQCNNGIYIDIFPADSVPNSKKQRIRTLVFSLKVRTMKFICMTKVYGKHYFDGDNGIVLFIKKNLLYRLSRFVAHDRTIKDLDRRYHNLCSKYKDKKSDSFRIISFDYGLNNRFAYEYTLAELTDTVKHDFEHIQIDIPRDYDSVLKKAFGNYMEFPPIESRVNDSEEMDPDTPYEQYMKDHDY